MHGGTDPASLHSVSSEHHDLGNYTERPFVYADGNINGVVMTVEEFRQAVEDGSFIDYDGCGQAAILLLDPKNINPSEVKNPGHIPDDATHIVWYNK